MRHGRQRSLLLNGPGTQNRQAKEHTSTDLKVGQTNAKREGCTEGQGVASSERRTKIGQPGVTSFVRFSGECCPAVDEVRSVKTATTGPVQVG